MPRFATLCFVSILPLILCACQTSDGYKRIVARTYPVVANRLEKTYELTDQQQVDVQRLREVAKDSKAITYDDGRPAWDIVAPFYRELIGNDPTMIPLRKKVWLQTADTLDRAQQAEQRYRDTLGMSPPPSDAPPGQ